MARRGILSKHVPERESMALMMSRLQGCNETIPYEGPESSVEPMVGQTLRLRRCNLTEGQGVYVRLHLPHVIHTALSEMRGPLQT
jgi:hypothetical protein